MAIKSSKKPSLTKPMMARNTDEQHRASTPLELFFDLVSVVAIASCAATFHHAISAGHGLELLPNFLLVFVGICWAWMNFTWFASAFDNDDIYYRIATMVMIAGAVVFAGALGYGFETLDFTVGLIGWIIMRLGLSFLWFRTARHNAQYKKTAYRYAFGLLFAQILWALLVLNPFPDDYRLLYMLAAVVIWSIEFCTTLYAESAKNIPWHRHHIIERFGLLNIIVLGEIFLTISLAVGYGTQNYFSAELVILIVTGFIIVFSMWWLYFLSDDHLISRNNTHTMVWTYAHFIIFAAATAVGVGIGSIVDVVSNHSKITMQVAHFATTIPIAVYIFGLWLARDRHYLTPLVTFETFLAIIVISLSSLIGQALIISAVALLALLTIRLTQKTLII